MVRYPTYVESYKVQNPLPRTNIEEDGCHHGYERLGPYHGLWLDDAPTKRIGVIPTPWTMTLALGFAEILQAHE